MVLHCLLPSVAPSILLANSPAAPTLRYRAGRVEPNIRRAYHYHRAFSFCAAPASRLRSCRRAALPCAGAPADRALRSLACRAADERPLCGFIELCHCCRRRRILPDTGTRALHSRLPFAGIVNHLQDRTRFFVGRGFVGRRSAAFILFVPVHHWTRLRLPFDIFCVLTTSSLLNAARCSCLFSNAVLHSVCCVGGRHGHGQVSLAGLR